LHPAQALLNNFREPQGNFLDAQEALRHNRTPKDELTTVVLTDYVKAFEMINPRWIQAVLRARQAPLWLTKLAAYLLDIRHVTPKIAGLMLDAIAVTQGVDMGNAISPWFFCIGMDPLIRLLNAIPKVIANRAYMDDNQNWGHGTEWMYTAQHTCDKFTPAGLVIAPHTCCLFWPASWGPTPPAYNNPNHPPPKEAHPGSGQPVKQSTSSPPRPDFMPRVLTPSSPNSD
jgi:hypothetical protein